MADQDNKLVTGKLLKSLQAHNDKSYATKEELKALDISSKLKDYAKTADIQNTYATKEDLKAVDISDQLENYATKEDLAAIDVSEQLENYATKEDLAAVDISDQLENYATKEDLEALDITDKLANYATTETVSNLERRVENTETDIENLTGEGGTIESLLNEISDLKQQSNKETNYDVDYNDETFMFSWYKDPEYDDDDNIISEATKSFKIQGGGGEVSSSKLIVNRIGSGSLTVRTGAKVVLGYTYSSLEDDGSENPVNGTAVWKLGTRIISTEPAVAGANYLDVTNYLSSSTTNSVSVTVTDPNGNVRTRTWSITIVDVRITSNFDDTVFYPVGKSVNISYIPYGNIAKTIHFLHDGEEIGTVSTERYGTTMNYSVPAQDYGSYNLEMYITALESDKDNYIETDHLFFDILFFDENAEAPVIGVAQQALTAQQYDTVAIPYTVYDATTETPVVTLSAKYAALLEDEEGKPSKDEDGNFIYDSVYKEFSNSIVTMNSNNETWNIKPSIAGKYELTISCKDVVKTITLIVNKLDIDVVLTPGSVFDFEPTGYSNNDISTRLWTNGTVHMSVSDNFDWTNGGYQVDENGDQYFCVKAGTTATFDYKLFGRDAKGTGTEFKVIYKIDNVKQLDKPFLTCAQGTGNTGIEMFPHETYVRSSANELFLPLSENDVIEFEFNIKKSSSEIPMVMTYEDGCGAKPLIYDNVDNFIQDDPVNITVGSTDCDVYLYRMRAYEAELSNKDILNNFIVDARNAEEMISRYNRNQIYNEMGNLTPESVAKACPQLRVIKLSAPYFTYDKKNVVAGGTAEMIYGGTPDDDEETIRYNNWSATGVSHNGQGTSSNNYKAAGQNIDIRLNVKDSSVTTITGLSQPVYTKDKVEEDAEQTYTEVKIGDTFSSSTEYFNSDYELIEDTSTVITTTTATTEGTKITLSDGTKVKKIKLTSSSVECNYLNLKVNIASSENANNALLQKRYDRYMPYVSLAKQNNPFVKNDMEFFNAVLFIQETDTDLTTHTQFGDNDWHFYAMGNIGDSKKTDGSRCSDPNDPKEFTVELIDWDKPLSFFPTDEKSLEIIENEPFADGDEFELPSGDKVASSYDFRYAHDDADEEVNKETFRAMYRMVTRDLTTDGVEDPAKVAQWKEDFKNTFILESVLYWYLFTLRYTMVDNRAKNTFWHYGKCTDGKYRFDFWDYDNDTALGINNAGKLTMTYGVEDEDLDETGSYYFRAGQSTFFTRVKKYFANELNSMYRACEDSHCWSAEGLINEFDAWQEQFPEELWRLDFERKYERPYTGTYHYGSDPQFLENMMNGRKKYQRRQFERDQEIYMASKFLSAKAQNDNIRIRGTHPQGVQVTPEYKLSIVPYSNFYITVYAGDTLVYHERAEAGKTYDVTVVDSNGVADLVYIWTASRVQSLGDLSRFYLYDCSFGNAEKLQELILGNTDPSYYNPSLGNSLGLSASNKLLEKIDIRNTSYAGSLDLSALHHLREVYAEGSKATGVEFANGGELRLAHLPDTLTSLIVKNLENIEDFNLAGINNLSTLVIENTPFINSYEIVNNAEKLLYLRLIGLNWPQEYGILDSAIFDRLMKLRGVNADGSYNLKQSILTGNAFVSVLRSQKKADYEVLWNELFFDQEELVQTYTATFLNYDGTVVETQYVDAGERAVLPSIIPTKPSTQSTNYTFDKWDKEFNVMYGDEVYTALFKESIRRYTIRYISNNTVLQTTEADYGDVVFYEGDIPTRTAANQSANVYYLFKEWDQSGYVNKDKDINAIFESCTYSAKEFEDLQLSDMTPVQIQTLIKTHEKMPEENLLASKVVEQDTISFDLGIDFNYEDVESKVIVGKDGCYDPNGAPFVATGSNHFDTYNAIGGLSLDEDWTLAIDYRFASSGNAIGKNTLVGCWSQANGHGFRLLADGGARCLWGDIQTQGTTEYGDYSITLGKRDIMVLRHSKGSDKLYVYKGNMPYQTDVLRQQEVEILTHGSYLDADADKSILNDFHLVLGANRAGASSYTLNGQGTIYWCKLWKGDLGNESCEKLASWIHEKVTLEMAGLDRYTIDQDHIAHLSFISKYLLTNPVCVNSSSTNKDGWAGADLKTMLNERLYNAIPITWRQLLKKVIVPSSIGGTQSTISRSNCYIMAPSATEIDPLGYRNAPYSNEGLGINWYIDNEIRIKTTEEFPETPRTWFTRSPQVTSSTRWIVTNTTGIATYGYANTLNNYVLIMFAI